MSAVQQDDHVAVATDGPSESASRSRPWLVDVAILLLAALVGALGTKYFVAQVYAIPSDSMQETVTAGEKIVAEKLSYRFGQPHDGDVVVFDAADYFDEPAPGMTTFVKRVIGVGGERIACCDSAGRITRNGVGIDESDYLKAGVSPSDVPFDVVVPAGRLWVMGDNRSDSKDSRAYLGRPGGGFIPTERVVGKAIAVSWPLSSARWID